MNQGHENILFPTIFSRMFAEPTTLEDGDSARVLQLPFSVLSNNDNVSLRPEQTSDRFAYGPFKRLGFPKFGILL